MGRITKSEAKAIREEKINTFASRNPFQAPRKGVDNGAAGRVWELENACDNSIKCGVSKGEQADDYVWVNQQDGTKKRYEREDKTNGGRVDEMMRKVERGRYYYVAYKLSICNKNTGYKVRECEPILCPVDVFLAALEECGALKVQNGKDGQPNGIAIQVSKKSWFEWVDNYPVKWQRNTVYNWFDFVDA